jgi:hypothetical protein
MEVAPGVKAVPVMVIVPPPLPAVAEAGLILVMVGGAGLIAKKAAGDQPLPGE